MKFLYLPPLVIGFLLLACPAASAQSTVAQPPSPGPSFANRSTTRSPAWEALLRRPQPSISAQPKPLYRLVNELRELGIPVWLHSSAKEDVANENAAITLPSPEIALIDRLRHGLRELNASLEIVGRQPSIISLDDQQDPVFFTTRVYDVSRIPISLAALNETIQTSVYSDCWFQNGGEANLVGLERPGKRILVVTAPFETHLAVEDLMDQLPRDDSIVPQHPDRSLVSTPILVPRAADSGPIRFRTGRSSPQRRGFGGGGFGGGGGIF